MCPFIYDEIISNTVQLQGGISITDHRDKFFCALVGELLATASMFSLEGEGTALLCIIAGRDSRYKLLRYIAKSLRTQPQNNLFRRILLFITIMKYRHLLLDFYQSGARKQCFLASD